MVGSALLLSLLEQALKAKLGQEVYGDDIPAFVLVDVHNEVTFGHAQRKAFLIARVLIFVSVGNA